MKIKITVVATLLLTYLFLGPMANAGNVSQICSKQVKALDSALNLVVKIIKCPCSDVKCQRETSKLKKKYTKELDRLTELSKKFPGEYMFNNFMSSSNVESIPLCNAKYVSEESIQTSTIEGLRKYIKIFKPVCQYYAKVQKCDCSNTKCMRNNEKFFTNNVIKKWEKIMDEKIDAGDIKNMPTCKQQWDR